MKDEFDEVKQTPENEEKEWKFDGEAYTQNDTILENDEFEIIIPATVESAPVVKPAEPVHMQEEKPKKKALSKKAKIALIAVLTVICVALVSVFGVFFFTVPNSDERMTPGNVALVVNDTKVSIGMYNYYYTCVSQQYIQYAQYGYYQDLDPSVDFAEQKTTNEDGDEVTWADMFVEETIGQLKYITAYYEAALDAGIKLTDEQKEEIETQLSSLKDMAGEANLSVDEYIKQNYGDYCGYATLSKMLEQCKLAESYFYQSSVTDTATDEEIQKYFEEHKDECTAAPFAYIQVVFDGEDVTQAQAEAKAKKYAKQIKTVTDMKKAIPKACDELLAQYVGMGYFKDAKEAATALAQEIETSIVKSDESFSKEATKWLFSDKTKKGDCATFTDKEKNVVYIILKTGNVALQSDEIYSVRHILVMPKDAEGNALDDPTTATDEQFAAAKKETEKILKEYNEGEKTEVEFAKLAEKYSEDTESTSNGQSGIYGGLCKGTRIGQMVKPFENWSTDKSRKYGDVDIVKSKYGYHIIFFVEDTELYLYNCKQAVISEKQSALVDEVRCNQHKGAMKKTKVAEPVVAEADEGDPTDDDSENMDY